MNHGSVKQQLTLRLDADIVHWFKTQAVGKRGHHTAINAALRKVVQEEMGKAGWVWCEGTVIWDSGEYRSSGRPMYGVCALTASDFTHRAKSAHERCRDATEDN